MAIVSGFRVDGVAHVALRQRAGPTMRGRQRRPVERHGHHVFIDVCRAPCALAEGAVSQAKPRTLAAAVSDAVYVGLLFDRHEIPTRWTGPSRSH